MSFGPDDHERQLLRLQADRLADRAIQELQGMQAAILYDGEISEEEFRMLSKWLDRHAECRRLWPVSEIYDTVQAIVADGVVTPEELGTLKRVLEKTAAAPDRAGRASESLFDESPALCFEGCSFLFTGKLQAGLRRDFQERVRRLGGKAAKSPATDLDYLVVGDLGTGLWMHSRYGRKIEVVMRNRQGGAATLVVREADFIAALEAEETGTDSR